MNQIVEQLVVQHSAPWWSEWLAPKDVLWEWFLGALLAFVVMQVMKNRRRELRQRFPLRKIERFNRFQMMIYTMPIAFTFIWPALYVLHPYSGGEALIYAVQGAIVSPFLITAILHVLGRIAPDVRRGLSQERRAHARGNAAAGERQDDTTRFL